MLLLYVIRLCVTQLSTAQLSDLRWSCTPAACDRALASPAGTSSPSRTLRNPLSPDYYTTADKDTELSLLSTPALIQVCGWVHELRRHWREGNYTVKVLRGQLDGCLCGGEGKSVWGQSDVPDIRSGQ